MMKTNKNQLLSNHLPLGIGPSFEWRGSNIALKGDVIDPTTYYVYGVNSTSIHGWYPMSTYCKNSIESSSGQLQLKNDAFAPGNNKFYGTSGAGVKNWYDLATIPAASLTEWDDAGAYVPNIDFKLKLYNAVGPISNTSIASQTVYYKVFGKTMYIRMYFNVTFDHIDTTDILDVLTVPPIALPNSLRNSVSRAVIYIKNVTDSTEHISVVSRSAATSLGCTFEFANKNYVIASTIIVELI